MREARVRSGRICADVDVPFLSAGSPVISRSWCEPASLLLTSGCPDPNFTGIDGIFAEDPKYMYEHKEHRKEHHSYPLTSK